MTTDELGVLTGRLGMIKGVTVKSASARENERNGFADRIGFTG